MDVTVGRLRIADVSITAGAWGCILGSGVELSLESTMPCPLNFEFLFSRAAKENNKSSVRPRETRLYYQYYHLGLRNTWAPLYDSTHWVFVSCTLRGYYYWISIDGYNASYSFIILSSYTFMNYYIPIQYRGFCLSYIAQLSLVRIYHFFPSLILTITEAKKHPK